MFASSQIVGVLGLARATRVLHWRLLAGSLNGARSTALRQFTASARGSRSAAKKRGRGSGAEWARDGVCACDETRRAGAHVRGRGI